MRTWYLPLPSDVDGVERTGRNVHVHLYGSTERRWKEHDSLLCLFTQILSPGQNLYVWKGLHWEASNQHILKGCATTVLLPSVYLRALKTGSHKSLFTDVHSIVIHDSPKWKQPNCPSADDWINKMWSIHTMQCHLAIKRKEILIHGTTQMNFVNTIQS